MFNQYPYNHAVFQGANKNYDAATPPSYNPSLITAVAHIEQGLSVPKVIMGGIGNKQRGLYKKSNSYSFNMWRSKRYVIGKPFNILSIKLPLTDNLVTDMIIVPVLNFDDGDKVVAGKSIELMNYTDAPAYIELSAFNFDANVHGNRNFALELHFRGTSLIGVSLPIKIELETETYG